MAVCARYFAIPTECGTHITDRLVGETLEQELGLWCRVHPRFYVRLEGTATLGHVASPSWQEAIDKLGLKYQHAFDVSEVRFGHLLCANYNVARFHEAHQCLLLSR